MIISHQGGIFLKVDDLTSANFSFLLKLMILHQGGIFLKVDDLPSRWNLSKGGGSHIKVISV